MKLAGQDGRAGACLAEGPGSGGLIQGSEKVSPLQECGTSRHRDVHLTVISGQFRQQVRLERWPQQPARHAYEREGEGGFKSLTQALAQFLLHCRQSGQGHSWTSPAARPGTSDATALLPWAPLPVQRWSQKRTCLSSAEIQGRQQGSHSLGTEPYPGGLSLLGSTCFPF